MTRPVWLVEADVSGPAADPLVAEVRRQGMACDLVRHRDLAAGRGVPAAGACALVYGTYPAVRHAQLHRGWVPGGWCDPAPLDCRAYYPHFGPFLLNQRFEFLTGVDALRQADRLFAAVGRGGEAFARPAGVDKLFAGRRVARGDFEAALAPARYDPATAVLVAEPQDLGREWRLVVAGDEVVAGCRYAVGGRRAVAPGCPAGVAAFALAVLAAVRWRPDPVFVLDVGEAADGLRVVELNGFSTSWVLACDLPAVVAAASGQAARAWAGGPAVAPSEPGPGTPGG